MKTLGIIGCGWLGYRLAQYLGSRFNIHTTVTKQAKINDLTAAGFHPETVNFNGSEVARWTKLDKLDAIIITVPLFSRNVDEQVLIKRRANLVHFIAGFKGTIILMSSIGVYPNKTGEVTEAFLSPSDTPGEQEIFNAFPQVTIFSAGSDVNPYRIAILLGPAERSLDPLQGRGGPRRVLESFVSDSLIGKGLASKDGRPFFRPYWP
ncbi:MAG: hypothetical protein EOP49_37105 [Sphingobacteriales bacterium]|nr:MAG: hypothetical protein EOP49_37105 [Sphingobacteriales bacterium]